ncbi:hypothetical protein [Nitrococcus mobilis]|uniref:F5/8 type C domain-containing protein n=1 Tax=Nitrococcus mobilis Nb-231 TaxID=314278 RepID=A4BVC4_9GAMM|nr:hypothetical protein [Nitrococcus mobilis]EAR20309.1 hypothetical protein NB231_02915 [Nitrococcus mobilis Nb-231]
MRKRIIAQNAPYSPIGNRAKWLNVERFAQVEISSEDPAYPIELAFRADMETGWRAAEAGEQVIRLLFDEALRIERIRIVFHEIEIPRMQEFVLHWSPDGHNFRELVRQQYTFSPPHTSEEVEDFRVDLTGVTAFELRIIPDISGGSARASLTELRLG